jgi:methylmalonyl-CoA mutase
MGFDVVSGPLFQTPEEAWQAGAGQRAWTPSVHRACCGPQDADPRTDRPPARSRPPDIKVVAGGVIPPQDYDYPARCGVQGIYGPGSNVVECAADMLRLLGHNMPPPMQCSRKSSSPTVAKSLAG